MNGSSKMNTMTRLSFAGALMIGLGAFAGCHHDKPHEYGRQRPPVEDLDPRDRDLQSKDVVSASDQMAQSLLAHPELNAAGDRWTLVVTDVENRSTNRRFDMNIFLERLKVNLARHGRGRVQLIENRDKYRELQSRELEGGGTGDEFGQGGGGGGRVAPGPRGRQPEYALHAKITDLPNRGTNYYLIDFSVTGLNTRDIVWADMYEVKVER
jgi:hypothetical protein